MKYGAINIDPETIDGTAPVKSDACFNKI